MSFNSLVFLVYFAVVLSLYYILPHKVRWVMLLAASYVFYAYFDFYLIFLIVATTLVSYSAGILMERTENERLKKLYLVITLAVCLGALLFFKYFNFLSKSVTALMRVFGSGTNDFVLELILPIGISFYTFQTLSYVIDVYRGSIKAEKHLGYYALFVAYFPQLVAGPIERPENLLPQLKEKHTVNKDNLTEGAKLFVLGFVKKVVIADYVAICINAVYNNADISALPALSVILATFLFIIQIYCDFSGYSDIATGCAKMMGVELMRNFNKPIGAASISEFWARWHISLSSWFNDYVYLPLNYRSIGKSHFKARVHFNLMVVFLLSGLWHGANWTFVLWGVYNGLCSIGETLLKKPTDRLCDRIKLKRGSRLRNALGWLKTTVILALGLVLFRSNTITDAWTMFTNLFTNWQSTSLSDTIALMGINVTKGLTLLFVCMLAYLMDEVVYSRGKDITKTDNPVCVNLSYVYVVWLVVVAWLALIASGQSSGFIYFQF